MVVDAALIIGPLHDGDELFVPGHGFGEMPDLEQRAPAAVEVRRAQAAGAYALGIRTRARADQAAIQAIVDRHLAEAPDLYRRSVDAETGAVTLGFYFTRIVVPAYLMLGYWFLLQVVGGIPALQGAGGGVAFWAHVGGFAAGIVLLPLFRVRARVEAHRRHIDARASRRTAATSRSATAPID